MDAVTTILGSAVRQTAPLAFATCGEYAAERSGTLNISIEAMMLGGAFFGVLGTSITGTVVGGLVLGTVVGFLVAFVHAQLSHRFAANTFVVGLSLNALLLGLTSYLLETADIDAHQAGVITIPLLSEIPWIGEPLFKNRWPIYLLVVVIPLTKWLIDRTRWGLEVRSAGEDPQAADVTGIDVNKRRRQSLYYCGVMSGLGGAYLSVGEVGVFNTNMVAGGGFLVNAAVIFGAWRLGGAMMGCVLFGTAASVQLALPALGHRVTPQLLIVLPYILALAAMVIFASRGRKPAALARPFVRGLA